MDGSYFNSLLGERMAKMGAVDRFIRVGVATLEAMVTLAIYVNGAGIEHHEIRIEVVDPDEGFLWGYPIAVYPLASMAMATADAVTVAQRLKLALRTSSSDVGWQVVYDPDRVVADYSSEPDILIGG